MSAPGRSVAGRDAAPAGSGAMFDRIAGRYDLLNRLMSLGLDRRWRRATVASLGLRAGERLLDLATGTGDLALAALRVEPRIEVVGLDPSPRMLALGRAKARRAGCGSRLLFLAGDAQRLPFADGRFDAVTIAFGIRNVPDRTRALAEMARVLRAGGRLAILELGTPQGPLAPFARAYIRGVVPRLGALLSGAAEYRYLERSIAAFPPPGDFAAMVRAAGFRAVRSRAFGFGSCHLFTGRRPDRTRP